LTEFSFPIIFPRVRWSVRDTVGRQKENHLIVALGLGRWNDAIYSFAVNIANFLERFAFFALKFPDGVQLRVVSSSVQSSGDNQRDCLILSPYQILVSSSSTWWSLLLVYAVCGVTIWSYIHVCKPTFWRRLL